MSTQEDDTKKAGMGRRSMLKSLAGIPVLGLLGIEVLRKINYTEKNNVRKEILRELGLDDLLSSVKTVTQSKGDLIRIGIVGFGSEGKRLARELGFMDKKSYEAESHTGVMETLSRYGNMNVAITGICEVFDLRAEQGLEAARHDIFTGGEIAGKHPVKRYMHYHDMLNDPNIDAVIIATPDHHHAGMAIEAAKAGKHVYCEKAPIHRENEIQPLYDAVKNSDIVYQLGHQIPQNAVFQQAQEIIRRGLLGKISHVETTTNRNTSNGAWIRHLDAKGNPRPGDTRSIDWQQWLGDAPYAPFSIERYYGWARYFDYDTGLFGQLFSHEFDAVNQLLKLGVPETVSATGGQYVYTDFGEIADVLHTSFEYPEKGISLTYSANLASSKSRPRTIYGRDASMDIGGELVVVPDKDSQRYADLLEKGLVNPSSPMVKILKGASLEESIDAVSSATAQYYASRGLIDTNIEGREWPLAHLHMREWLNCIRDGGEPSANIEMAWQESVVIAMADISYRENCRTRWDAVNKKIIRMS